MRRHPWTSLLGGALAALGVATFASDAVAQPRYDGAFRPTRERSVYHEPAPQVRSSGNPLPSQLIYPLLRYSSAVRAGQTPAPAGPGDASAALRGYDIPAGSLPWNNVRSHGEAAHKYTLEASLLPQRPRGAAERVVLVVHLPADARLWVEGQPVRLTGDDAVFHSPALAAGRRYVYALEAAWREDGKWVGQTRRVVVQAGRAYAVSLVHTPSPPLPTRP
jgi:uncharacterized protein (TIGR03000 family)